MVSKSSREGGKKSNFLHGRRVTFDEVISTLAELTNKRKFIALHVLDAAPSEVRRLLASEACEVTFVDERDVGTLCREGCSRDGTIDASTYDHHVECLGLKFLKIAIGEADIYPRLAPTCEWDTAAAHAVLNGAGGEIFQVNGEPMTYGKTEILNPHFIAKAHS